MLHKNHIPGEYDRQKEYDKHMQMTEYLQASPNFYLHLANLCFSLVPPFESLKWSLNIQKIN